MTQEISGIKPRILVTGRNTVNIAFLQKGVGIQLTLDDLPFTQRLNTAGLLTRDISEQKRQAVARFQQASMAHMLNAEASQGVKVTIPTGFSPASEWPEGEADDSQREFMEALDAISGLGYSEQRINQALMDSLKGNPNYERGSILMRQYIFPLVAKSFHPDSEQS